MASRPETRRGIHHDSQFAKGRPRLGIMRAKMLGNAPNGECQMQLGHALQRIVSRIEGIIRREGDSDDSSPLYLLVLDEHHGHAPHGAGLLK